MLLGWNILKLRWNAAAASVRLRGFSRRNGTLRRGGLRGFSLLLGLTLCAMASAGAITLSVTARHELRLLELDGSLPKTQDVILLDPYQRDENLLSPGRLYERPVAAVLAGAEPALLRMRLECTLLTVARDENGLIVISLPEREPGENYIPRTISEDAVLQMLLSKGFCKRDIKWADLLGQRLPAKRLPGGSNDGGRLLVFEKKTVTEEPNPNLQRPDVDVLLPEDVETFNVSRVTYSYMGFYVIDGDDGQQRYQPVHLTLSSTQNQTKPKPPAIQGLSYEFFQWDISQEQLVLFGAADTEPLPLAFQAGKALQPLTEWQKPTDGWFYDEDGWIYYGQALAPGVMTPLLLESFSVGPESPLLQNETRFRLRVRAQSAQLTRMQILDQWHTGKSIDNLGSNSMSDEAARFAAGVLAALGIREEE
ncbi:MAG: hypothetical protein LBG83_00820 [Oscillospiraceae bacterium]|nr:hypothetical protein [Oscillospiraceae bacterium]